MGKFVLKERRIAREEIAMNTKQIIFNLFSHVNQTQYSVDHEPTYAEDDISSWDIIFTVANGTLAAWVRAHC